jgi:hypothetical protein
MRTETSDAVVTVGAGPDALTRALATSAEWLWFLADGARPREDALTGLLEAREPQDATPATVLAGLLVDERGAPLHAGFQAAPQLDADAAVRLVGQGLLPIRSTGFAHCLVARAAFDRHGRPDDRRFGPFAAEEWTARVLRDEAGYLVGASIVQLGDDVAPFGSARPLGAAVRMLSTGTWGRGEAVRALRRTIAGVRGI